MSDDSVGDYVSEHFFSSHQKVGTFKLVNAQKQGGNVATYFCTHEGTVLHAIAGPVDAKEFLKEARWVIETRKAAVLEMKGDIVRYGAYFKKAHADRYLEEYANAGLAFGPVSPKAFPHFGPGGFGGMPLKGFGGGGFFGNGLGFNPFVPPPVQRVTKLPAQRPSSMPVQAQVHWLLGTRAMPKLSDIYKTVYQDILRERISNLPVRER